RGEALGRVERHRRHEQEEDDHRQALHDHGGDELNRPEPRPAAAGRGGSPGAGHVDRKWSQPLWLAALTSCVLGTTRGPSIPASATVPRRRKPPGSTCPGGKVASRPWSSPPVS